MFLKESLQNLSFKDLIASDNLWGHEGMRMILVICRYKNLQTRYKDQDFRSTLRQGGQVILTCYWAFVAAAKSLQTCPTLCNPIDGSPPGSPFPGILQARTLKWVAISFSSAWKWKVKVKSLSRVLPLATPWTTAYQAPPSMGFSRQEYWSGVP